MFQSQFSNGVAHKIARDALYSHQALLIIGLKSNNGQTQVQIWPVSLSDSHRSSLSLISVSLSGLFTFVFTENQCEEIAYLRLLL